jgi:type II secretory pathway pseudopilin PulG
MSLKSCKSNKLQPNARIMVARQGFTLVELLAVVLLLMFMLVLIFPTLARAKQRAMQATCQSNLRQLGVALQTYANDNAGSLPGPAASLAAANYDCTSTNQLAWYLSEFLGVSRPDSRGRTVNQLLCPAQIPEGGHGASYMLNDGRSLPGPPFGSPASPVQPPLKLSTIATSTFLASCFAVADADKANVNARQPGWSALPYAPVHAKFRNELFFDWHVSSKGW